MRPDFFENVRMEAIQNVQRLRHRASLALWCGNNEMEWGWVEWGWDVPENLGLKRAYDQMFHHLLPDICAAEDPDRAYWPSSPSSGVPFRRSQQRAAPATRTTGWSGTAANRSRTTGIIPPAS